jgi:membrane-bound inhibitor of C-type lysozyme
MCFLGHDEHRQSSTILAHMIPEMATVDLAYRCRNSGLCVRCVNIPLCPNCR